MTHWDADGLCSAVLLRRYLENSGFKNIGFLIPPLGEFGIDKSIKKELTSQTVLFVCDLNFGKKIFDFLTSKTAMVVNFDHHNRKEKLKDVLDFSASLPSATPPLPPPRRQQCVGTWPRC